jgi:hypothetical protein
MRKMIGLAALIVALGLLIGSVATGATISFSIPHGYMDGSPFDYSNTAPEGVHHYKFYLIYDQAKSHTEIWSNPDVIVDNVPKTRKSWCIFVPGEGSAIKKAYLGFKVIFNNGGEVSTNGAAFYLRGNIIDREAENIDSAAVGPLDWLFVTNPANFGKFVTGSQFSTSQCPNDNNYVDLGKPDFLGPATDNQVAASYGNGWIDGSTLGVVNGNLGNATK